MLITGSDYPPAPPRRGRTIPAGDPTSSSTMVSGDTIEETSVASSIMVSGDTTDDGVGRHHRVLVSGDTTDNGVGRHHRVLVSGDTIDPIESEDTRRSQ